MAQPVGTPPAGGSNQDYLAMISAKNEEMKAFNAGLTMLEMDMQKNNNAYKAIQKSIQGMPA